MTIDDERRFNRLDAERFARFRLGIALTAAGGVAVIGGVAVGIGADGDLATGAGVATGVGVVVAAAAAAMAWCARPGQPIEAVADRQATRRDRLQRARSQQLVIFPAIMLAFMVQAHQAMQAVLAGQGDFGAYLQVSLPVLYGWLVPAIVMGWDWTTRKNRSLLDDELTQAMRAQAMMLAFVVLMAGATGAMILGMWRPTYGIAALPYVLAIGGAAAGLRFAWLDRKAGSDG